MTDLARALRDAENELQQLRSDRASTASLVNNPIYDLPTRVALAELLGFPSPRDAREDSTVA